MILGGWDKSWAWVIYTPVASHCCQFSKCFIYKILDWADIRCLVKRTKSIGTNVISNLIIFTEHSKITSTIQSFQGQFKLHLVFSCPFPAQQIIYTHYIQAYLSGLFMLVKTVPQRKCEIRHFANSKWLHLIYLGEQISLFIALYLLLSFFGCIFA